MNQATPSWMSAIERCLEQGSADPVLISYIDEILSWRLNGAHWDKSAKGSFEEFLDQLLIANPNNYQELFPSDLSAEQAKARYRQLIGLFHPDRGAKAPTWLTYRAERLNSAYSEYQKKRHSQNDHQGSTSPKSRSSAISGAAHKSMVEQAPKAKRRIILPLTTRDIRKWLGSPEKFEKKVFLGLIAAAALFVTLLLLSVLLV